jgi:hypothetical protein|tara:strand:- start:208 stop:825 length:618 start_codon:yes stop_codon:yes gene_type:complete
MLQMETFGREVVSHYRVLLCFLLLLVGSSIPTSSAATGGEDIEADFNGSPMTNIEHSTNIPDLSTWSISVSLEPSAAENGTKVKILSQMCTNEGVCAQPGFMEVQNSEDNSSWTSSWQTIDDYAYVNWMVTLNYSDGEEETWPKSGEYAKAWSACWYDIDNDKWGGEGCNDDDDSSFLPSIGFLATMAMMALAARKVRSEKGKFC